MRSLIKKVGIVICLTCLLLSMVGIVFAQESPYLKFIDVKTVDTTEYKKDPPWKIGFSNASITNEWRVFLVSHIKYEASKYPEIEEIFITDAMDSPTKQTNDIEDLLIKGIDLLIVSPCVAEALSPVVDKVMAMGIPVIVVDRMLITPNWVSFTACDNVEAGRLSMEWLADQLGGKGNIVMLSGTAGAGPAVQRENGMRPVLNKYPDIKVLAHEFTNWSVVQGKKIMATLIQKYGDSIDGVWSDSSLQGGGAVDAYVDAGLPIPPFTALDDGNRLAKQMVNYKFECFMISYPTWMGLQSVRLAYDILNGVPVPHVVYLPGTIITKENVDQWALMDKPDALNLDSKLPPEWMPEQYR